jgi:hypothetical protein
MQNRVSNAKAISKSNHTTQKKAAIQKQATILAKIISDQEKTRKELKQRR